MSRNHIGSKKKKRCLLIPPLYPENYVVRKNELSALEYCEGNNVLKIESDFQLERR